MQLRRREPRRSLVASAARLVQSNKNTGKEAEGWQIRALQNYDTCGEVRFCSQFYARMLARVRFFPATINPDGTLDAIESGPVVDLFDRIQDPGGGRAHLQYDYGRLMFVTGEGALFVTGEDTDRERWQFLWREEVVVPEGEGNRAYQKNSKGQIVAEGVAYRMWTPHPRWSDRADSPLRAVLDIAEELALLTAAVRSTAVSRVLKGLLLVPSEIAPAPPEEGLDEDPELNIFTQKLIEHISAQIENPGSAEAQTPLYMEGAYDYLDGVRWIEMHNAETDYMERDLRIEAIKRLALGLDMPPEALEGFSNTNHWAAQQIQWDMWRAHGVPIADRWATDVAEVYLRPTLEEMGESWQNVTITYDDSQVVVSPDQTAVADEAMDRAAISFAGYRKLKGIPEDYAPSAEEQKFVFGIKTRDPVVAGLEKEAVPVRGPQPGPGTSQNGQPNAPESPSQGRIVSRQEARTASIVGAAHLALRNCRARAGAKLRTQVVKPPQHQQVCVECRQAIDGIPNAVVASVLGVETLESLAQRDPITLVKGGTADFAGILEEWGISGADSAVLCERIEAFAAKTLFQSNTPDLPPGFASHVEHALEMAERSPSELKAVST